MHYTPARETGGLRRINGRWGGGVTGNTRDFHRREGVENWRKPESGRSEIIAVIGVADTPYADVLPDVITLFSPGTVPTYGYLTSAKGVILRE